MEANFDFSNLSEQEYESLIMDLLNKHGSYNLQQVELKYAAIDLVDYGVDNNPIVGVKIFRKPFTNESSLLNTLKTVTEEVYNLTELDKFIFVFTFKVDPYIRAEINSSFAKRVKINYSIIEIDWIEDKLTNYPDIAEKYLNYSDSKTLNIDLDKYYSLYPFLFKSEEFCLQKALDVLDELKKYDASLDKNTSKGFWQLVHPFKKLDELWRESKAKPSEFVDVLNHLYPDLNPLYLLLNKFIAYVDWNAWNKNQWNEYTDHRVIANTGARQNQIVEYCLKFAINNFKIVPELSDRVFFRAMDYLLNPSTTFNILSSKHRALISKYFLGKVLEEEEFHFELKKYFDNNYSFPIGNPINLTYLYTRIIYDKTVRELWDESDGKKDNGKDDEEPEPFIDDNSEKKGNKTTNEKIPFHLDQVVDEDKLGREPVAKAFVDIIKNDIFTDKLDHSFMVHLQGEWGAGKSSFLKFIEKNLNTDNENWIVVNYNAWQNQHIKPPWWTLIDQIFYQANAKLSWDQKIVLWFKENKRRIIWYSGWQKLFPLVLTIFFTILVIIYGKSIIGFLNESASSSTDQEGLSLGVFTKIIIALSSTFGVIYSFSKFITTPFLIRSSDDAASFMAKAANPMARIKKHFNKLVENINSKEDKRQLAIFIDDIDRCNKDFIVQLLEGIQTLFKEKRVLYIIAGDKDWITTSFGNKYEEFAAENLNSMQLGELFLEKAFQLSIRMPNINDEAKKEYWNHILGIKADPNNQENNSFESLDKAKQKEIEEELDNTAQDITSPEYMKEMGNKFKLSGDTVTNLVIEKKNSNDEEIRHLLNDFHTIVNPNPRSIIRLANNYTMTRSTLIAERKSVSADKIFRWLVIEDLIPSIKAQKNLFTSIEAIEEFINKDLKDEELKIKCLELLLDKEEAKNGTFTIEEIKDIIGL